MSPLRQCFTSGQHPSSRAAVSRTAATHHRRPRHWAGALLLVLGAGTGASHAAPDTRPPATSPAGITIVGRVPVDKGRLRCGLYDRDGWLRRPLQSTSAAPRARQGICHFQPSAAGTYALGAFLDTNDNGSLDRNWLGFPTEPYGVSNGARARFLAPPSFDAAKVAYAGGQLKLELRLE